MAFWLTNSWKSAGKHPSKNLVYKWEIGCGLFKILKDIHRKVPNRNRIRSKQANLKSLFDHAYSRLFINKRFPTWPFEWPQMTPISRFVMDCSPSLSRSYPSWGRPGTKTVLDRSTHPWAPDVQVRYFICKFLNVLQMVQDKKKFKDYWIAKAIKIQDFWDFQN